MNALKANYFEAYRSLKLTRDAAGVLVAELHSNGGPFTFTAQDHTELVDAFYRIAQDRENRTVILKEQVAISLQVSNGPRLAMSPIPAFGAKFTIRCSDS